MNHSPVTPAEAAQWMEQQAVAPLTGNEAVDFIRGSSGVTVAAVNASCLGMIYPDGRFQQSRLWRGAIPAGYMAQINDEIQSVVLAPRPLSDTELTWMDLTRRSRLNAAKVEA